MKALFVCFLGLAACLMVAVGSHAADAPKGKAGDYSQWRGPNRDGISTESGWLTTWPEGGPKKLWSKNVGFGCSSFSVKDGRVYTIGNTNDVDSVQCMDTKTGDVVWKYDYACPKDPKQFEGGSGTTPTLDDERAYTISRSGHLNAIDIKTGKLAWTKDVTTEWSMKQPKWGFASSPLVVGDLLIVDADAVLALKKKTGELVWKTELLGAAYSSPVEFKLDGKSVIADFNAVGLVILESETGKEVCRHPWKTQYDVNAATPIISGNEIFISSGYNHGCALLKLDGGKVSVVWENKNMRNHFNSSVLWKGFLYGFDESDLTCLDWKTGEAKWTEKSLGKGSLMIADGKLVIMSETGTAVIADPAPEAFKKLTEAKVLEKRCWVVPVLADGKLFCRNNEGDVVCLDLKGN